MAGLCEGGNEPPVSLKASNSNIMATKIVRQHTLRATFDKEQQRPTALDVHRWIDEVLKIKDEELQTIQLVAESAWL
ncbi:hypothetical protein ANN_06243 [Periplaneta americana]|uniref:Uncharacterized protein n=1 Tax=Periplaneta americana TaxID=6978 RepID=A0ABQ8TEL7_PERAM|nr:hypothetical protein ANN_06243 [Periplaneta americana]